MIANVTLQLSVSEVALRVAGIENSTVHWKALHYLHARSIKAISIDNWQKL